MSGIFIDLCLPSVYTVVRNSLPAGLREGQPCLYCFYSVVQHWLFAPQERPIAPINVKFSTGDRTAGPLPGDNLHVYWAEMWEYIYI